MALINCEIPINASTKIELSTGYFAPRSLASVYVSSGDTRILVVANIGGEGYLNVHHQSKAYALSKIPGGFIKREGRPSEEDIIISREIDKMVRPAIRADINNEIQIVSNLLSYDSKIGNVAIMAAYGAIVCLRIIKAIQTSIVPVRACTQDNIININPDNDCLEKSACVLSASLCDDKLYSLGFQSQDGTVSEDTLKQMLEEAKIFASSVRPYFDKFVSMNEINHSKFNYIGKDDDNETLKNALNKHAKEIQDEYSNTGSVNVVSDLIANAHPDMDIKQVQDKCKLQAHHYWRSRILNGELRMDGRSNRDIRKLTAKVNILPCSTGSACFSRGNTQVLSSVVVGNNKAAQMSEGLAGIAYEHFMLHYYFPSSCVGEVGKMGAVKRREIGHGHLACNAIKPVLKFDHDSMTIRAVAEVLSAEGSTSMATVCATSLALKTAGLNMPELVAGLSIGLIQESNLFCILSDITDAEDGMGDIDCKVAGTRSGITAISMDVKAPIAIYILSKVVARGMECVKKILDTMYDVLPSNIQSYSDEQHNGFSKKIQIDKNFIKYVIGKKGANIKSIVSQTGSVVNITDDGVVDIKNTTSEKIEETVDLINSYTRKNM